MATQETPFPAPEATRRRWWPRILLVLVLVLVSVATIAWFANRTVINGYALTGTSYMARVGCSCVYIGGRSVEDCAKDKVAGMEIISLSQDEAAKSVTATFPLVASQTATYREDYGCVMEEWSE